MMLSPFAPSTFLLEITFIYTFTELHMISICTFIKIGSFACSGWKGKGSKTLEDFIPKVIHHF